MRLLTSAASCQRTLSGFDFDSGNPLVEVVNNSVFEPIFDPYNLWRGSLPTAGQTDARSVLMEFVGQGHIYDGYTQASYLADQEADNNNWGQQ
ncbi:hypothetical protein [Methylomonas methanica]|uniref:hypothetical protein n=1 Tax=Methylomonas methanica TaxID=421 RepID=UPI0011D29679|nr:hypothetical protein [Methylomonas methanica]